MRLLVRRPGLSVGEVAHQLGLRVSNASTTVRALIGRGLLRRQGDPADGRVVRLAPTARAQAIRRRREAEWERALRRRLASLPADDRQRLLEASTALALLARELAAPTDGRPAADREGRDGR